MDQCTLTCLTMWFIATGRRLEIIPPARARFVEPSVSNRAEPTGAVRHKNDSFHVEVMTTE